MKEQKTFTRKQTNALKYLIFKSNKIGEETKKVCFALINASCGLAVPVLYIVNSREVNTGIRKLISTDYNTHLNEVMKAMGTKFRFSYEDDYYDMGFFSSERKYTVKVWLSPILHDKRASRISPARVKRIKLTGSLYKHLVD